MKLFLEIFTFGFTGFIASLKMLVILQKLLELYNGIPAQNRTYSKIGKLLLKTGNFIQIILLLGFELFLFVFSFLASDFDQFKN